MSSGAARQQFSLLGAAGCRQRWKKYSHYGASSGLDVRFTPPDQNAGEPFRGPGTRIQNRVLQSVQSIQIEESIASTCLIRCSAIRTKHAPAAVRFGSGSNSGSSKADDAIAKAKSPWNSLSMCPATCGFRTCEWPGIFELTE